MYSSYIEKEIKIKKVMISNIFLYFYHRPNGNLRDCIKLDRKKYISLN